MNKLNFFTKLFFSATIGLCVVSCGSDDSPETTNSETTNKNKKETKYIVAFQENKIGEADEVDYILELSSIKDLTTGEFGVKGQGIQQTGWRYFHQSDNTLFTAGYSTDLTCNSFHLNDDGLIKEKTKFTFDKTLNIFTNTQDGKMIAVQLNYGSFDKLRFHVINVKTGKVENIIEREFDYDKGAGTEEAPGTIPWITGMVQQDGKMYISYYKTSADGKTNTTSNDKAYMSIFSYPAMKLEKVITDDRTSNIGVNGGDTGIVKSENGDMYTYSSSALSAGFTEATKPSGILKIKKGTSKFDSNYFFDVENATNGGKLYWMQYVGNGKALARIIIDDEVGKLAWGSFLTKDALKMVVLDLDTKTVTDVQGVPNPQGQRYISGTGLLIEDGKIYTSITDPNETAVYIIDAETATAKKGAVATNARSLKGIFKLKN